MSHDDLIAISAKWLKRELHCKAIFTEPKACTYLNEQPDCIGWVGGYSVVVECKTTLSDFRNDQKKKARHEHFTDKALGHWRFYVTPAGLLDSVELPAGWGWYEVRGRKLHHRAGAKYTNASTPPFSSHTESEVAILVSQYAKLQSGKAA